MSRYGDLVLLNSVKFFFRGHSCYYYYYYVFYWYYYFGASLIAEHSLGAGFIGFTATFSTYGLSG
jgi:hypothetical protein